ncbi:hypothetical protein E2C11_09870 [Streptomyces lavendulae]|nr:hypothetical protein [Streptomyces lavendulae]TXJ82035.1 hypothetical protein E2C11_09870 [Streptomyces lavendulae]
MTRRSIRLAFSVCVATLATAGCTASGQHGTASPPRPARLTTPPAPAESPDTPSASPAPSVHRVPLSASDGIEILAAGTAVRGDATYPIPGGIKAGRTLVIAIDCQGPGRLTAQVPSAGVSFPLRCEKGEVLPAMNEIQMPRTAATGSLRFTSDPDVTWSFALGWNRGRAR